MLLLLDQTGESQKAMAISPAVSSTMGIPLKRFRHFIVFHLLTQSCQDHDGNGKAKRCGKAIYDTGQNTVFPSARW